MQSHTLIGFDLNTLIIDSARQMGIKSNREHFQIRTDTIMVQKPLAECLKGMLCVDLGVDLPLLPLYLVAQKELRVSRKLRVVFDSLREALMEFYLSRGWWFDGSRIPVNHSCFDLPACFAI